jgi:glutamate--cysteine ligase
MSEKWLNALLERFRKAEETRKGEPRQLALELKFPLVTRKSGEAASREMVAELWSRLAERGWQPMTDSHTGECVGATRADDAGTDVLSSATGYAVIELSTAPGPSLDALRRRVRDSLDPVVEFCRERRLLLLGHGIHPVTPPDAELLTSKGRNAFWDDIFTRRDPEARVHLFTATAASQAHVDIHSEEAGDALLAFNGLAPAEIALNANSGVWGREVDDSYKCVHESFWDRWMPEEDRVGMPAARPDSLADYVRHLVGLRPVYVEREGRPIMVPQCRSFEEYGQSEEVIGESPEGESVAVSPAPEDFELHLTFCWHNARVSRYCTLENRVNCQQPMDAMLAVGALTLGLAERLPAARTLVESYDWQDLRAARLDAMRNGLGARVGDEPIERLCGEMLEIARDGLRARGQRGETYLNPLWRRMGQKRCPADVAASHFRREGVEGVLDRFAIK